MLNDVTVDPPDEVENAHETLELTVNDRSKPELAVLTLRVTAVPDHTDTTKEPPSAPPLSVACELCTANAADVIATPASTLPAAVTLAELLDVEHCTKNVDVDASAATLTDVTEPPPDVASNTHVAPLALTPNANANPLGLVDTLSVYAFDDTVPISSVPAIAPPLMLACAPCTANADDVTVTDESTLPTAVTVADLLPALHCM